MRRSPIQRRTPLAAGAAMLRRTPLAQVSPRRLAEAVAAGRPARAATRPRDTGPDQLTVEAILERAAYACERCSGPLGPVRGRDWHCHHRRPRAAGGSRRADTNSPANLVAICPDCHTAVESRRGEALAEGWLVTQVSDPAAVALLIERGSRWVYLTHDGRYSEHPNDAEEATHA